MAKKTLSVIGKPLRKIDAMAKCAGETVFADDLNLPRTIYAKLLRSPHPHARVLSINTSRAMKLDGVFAGADLEGLAGRLVEVRGVVLEAGGPLIELSHPEQMQVLP